MTQTFENAGRVCEDLLDTALDSLSAVSSDVRTIGLEALDYAKSVFEAGGVTLGRLMSAQSIEKDAKAK